MAHQPRVCPDCGCTLDPGEICDCKKSGEAAVAKGEPGDPANCSAMEEAEAAAYQEGVEAKVTITLEKLPGSETFKRNIEASSPSAAVNGVAVLIRELATAMGVPVTTALSLLAVALMVPTIRAAKNEGAGA